MSKTTNRSIVVQGAVVAVTSRGEQDYISLSDRVRNFEKQGALIENWLRAKDTVLFLGVWEQLNNPGFNSLEFEGTRNEAGRNSFSLSPSKWVQATSAIGICAKAAAWPAIRQTPVLLGCAQHFSSHIETSAYPHVRYHRAPSSPHPRRTLGVRRAARHRSHRSPRQGPARGGAGQAQR